MTSDTGPIDWFAPKRSGGAGFRSQPAIVETGSERR
jgi:hypothetical protein